MTTKVKPTVEKWDFDVADYVHQGEYDDDLPIYGIEEANKAVKALLSHSVQEAKAETISMIIDRIEMWADDGQIPTTEHITSRLSYLLASLKQEEGK